MSYEYKVNPIQPSSFPLKKNPDPEQQEKKEDKEQNKENSSFSSALHHVQHNIKNDNEQYDLETTKANNQENSSPVINVDSFLDLIQQSRSISKNTNKF